MVTGEIRDLVWLPDRQVMSGRWPWEAQGQVASESPGSSGLQGGPTRHGPSQRRGAGRRAAEGDSAVGPMVGTSCPVVLKTPDGSGRHKTIEREQPYNFTCVHVTDVNCRIIRDL